MKKLIILLLSVLILNISCNKSDSTATNTNANGSITFTINGNDVSYSGAFNAALFSGVQMLVIYDPQSWITTYSIQGYKNNSNGIILSIVFSNNLKLEVGKTYKLSRLSASYSGGANIASSDTKIYGDMYDNADYIQLTITSLTSKEVNGVFYGQLSTGYNNLIINITNGKLNHVPIN